MNVLFDLDGTLTDSRDGIVRCYQHALAELAHLIPPDSELLACVGPPLASCFKTLLGTSDPLTIERAITSYRTRFERQGMFESAVYSGIVEALSALTVEAHRLYVVTSKPGAYANRILAHFDLVGFFQGVYGPDLTDRACTKTSLVRTALSANDINRHTAVMVGDRADDMRAAKDNGVRAIGVTWGYGSPEELQRAGADALARSASEVVEYIARAA